MFNFILQIPIEFWTYTDRTGKYNNVDNMDLKTSPTHRWTNLDKLKLLNILKETKATCTLLHYPMKSM